ncbi:MAG TPA: hypothetical protein VGF44_15370 [Terriglobales bacterium]
MQATERINGKLSANFKHDHVEIAVLLDVVVAENKRFYAEQNVRDDRQMQEHERRRVKLESIKLELAALMPKKNESIP